MNSMNCRLSLPDDELFEYHVSHLTGWVASWRPQVVESEGDPPGEQTSGSLSSRIRTTDDMSISWILDEIGTLSTVPGQNRDEK